MSLHIVERFGLLDRLRRINEENTGLSVRHVIRVRALYGIGEPDRSYSIDRELADSFFRAGSLAAPFEEI